MHSLPSPIRTRMALTTMQSTGLASDTLNVIIIACNVIHICLVCAAVMCPVLNKTNKTMNNSKSDPSSLYTVNTTLNNYTTTALVTCITGYAIDPWKWSNNTVDTYCNEFGNWSTYPITCQSKNIYTIIESSR
jgi:hypothetical protein